MVKKRLLIPVFLSILLTVSSCQTIEKASVQYDENVDFSSIRKFTWAYERPLSFHRLESVNVVTSLESSLMDKTIRLLSEKNVGFTPNSNQADIAVSFSVGARNQILTQPFRFPPAVSGDRLDQPIEYWPGATVDEVEYLEGQICVDMRNMEGGQPIWHGTVRDIRLDSKEIFDEQTVSKILSRILENFPP